MKKINITIAILALFAFFACEESEVINKTHDIKSGELLIDGEQVYGKIFDDTDFFKITQTVVHKKGWMELVGVFENSFGNNAEYFVYQFNAIIGNTLKRQQWFMEDLNIESIIPSNWVSYPEQPNFGIYYRRGAVIEDELNYLLKIVYAANPDFSINGFHIPNDDDIKNFVNICGDYKFLSENIGLKRIGCVFKHDDGTLTPLKGGDGTYFEDEWWGMIWSSEPNATPGFYRGYVAHKRNSYSLGRIEVHPNVFMKVRLVKNLPDIQL